MKIDFEMLERMVAAGATGAMVLEVLRLERDRHEAKLSKKRPGDKVRKRRTRGGQERTRGGQVGNAKEVERQQATFDDTPRARLFREGKGALLTLKISDGRAGGLIAQWLKLTNDDEQLVLATILKAQSLAVADAPSWILATLKGKANGQRPRGGDRGTTGDFFSGLATVAADIAGDDPLAGPADAEIPRGRIEIDGERAG